MATLFEQFDNREIPSQGKFHTLFSTRSNEWYTPSCHVEAARRVMGGIDLDPASCAEANLIVKASCYYTIEDNGLSRPFKGRIWCNPPYGTTNGKSNQGIWARRLVAEYDCGNVSQAILLVNAKTDTRWFEMLWRFLICFTSGRINYYSSKQTTTIGNTNGSCFVYLGPNESKFIEVFSQFGRIAKAIDTPKPKVAPLSLWEVRP